MLNQPQINPLTTAKPKKTNWLAILILVAVLIGAIIIAGYYYFIPQDRENKNTNSATEETPGFFTYLNEKHDFTLKYPDNWGPLSPYDFGEVNEYYFGEYEEYSGFIIALISIKIEENKGNLSLEQIVAKESTNETPFLDLTVNGLPAKQSSQVTPEDLPEELKNMDWSVAGVKTTYFLRDQDIYKFVAYLPAGQENINRVGNVYDRMLATFKFTVANNDWLIYENEVYQVSYPAGWQYHLCNVSTGIDCVEFRPPELTDDFLFSLERREMKKYYTNMQQATEEILNVNYNLGSKVEKQDVKVDGFPAVKITVSNPNLPRYIQIDVFFEQGGYLYHINNGDINDERFEDFYQSFKFK
ncbi:MAG: hypothetical protein ABIH38_04855 [Patescibacteria group bacterium]